MIFPSPTPTDSINITDELVRNVSIGPHPILTQKFWAWDSAVCVLASPLCDSVIH